MRINKGELIVSNGYLYEYIGPFRSYYNNIMVTVKSLTNDMYSAQPSYSVSKAKDKDIIRFLDYSLKILKKD